MPTFEELRKLREQRLAAPATPPPLPKAPEPPAEKPRAPVAPPAPVAPKATSTPKLAPAVEDKPRAPVVAPAAPKVRRTPEDFGIVGDPFSPENVAKMRALENDPEWKAAQQRAVAGLAPQQRAAVAALEKGAEDAKRREAERAEEVRRQEEIRAENRRLSAEAARSDKYPENLGEAVDQYLRPVTKAAEAVKPLAISAATGVARNLTTDPKVAERITEVGQEAMQASFQEQQEKAREEQRRKDAFFEKLYGDDADMIRAREFVKSLPLEEKLSDRKESPAGKYISWRVQQILTEKFPDPEKARSGPEYDAAVAEARTKAVDELARLYQTGQLAFPISLEDATGFSPEATWATAFAPKKEMRPGGKVIRSESLPGWVLSVPFSVLDAALLTAVQGAAGDERGAEKRFLENVADRQDLLSARIEGDPDLQADLASGDMDRVNSALLTLSPYMAVLLATPDPVSAVGGAAQAAKRASQIRRYSGKVADLWEASGKGVRGTDEFLQKLGPTLDAADAETKEAARVSKAVERAVGPTRDVQAGADFDATVDAYAQFDRPVAQLLRSRFWTTANSDDAIQAYTRYVGGNPDEYRKGSLPPADWTPDDEAALVKAQDDLDDARLRRREAEEDYMARTKAANRTPGPDLQRMLAPLDAEVNGLNANVGALMQRRAAAEGRDRFEARYDDIAAAVLQDVGVAATTGRSEGLRAADVFGEQQPPPEVDADLAARFGDTDMLRTLERLGVAATGGDVEAAVRSIGRLPEETRNLLAQRLGFTDFDALKKVAGTAGQDNDAALKKIGDEIQALRAKVVEDTVRLADLRATPQTRAAYDAAKAEVVAAEKALKAAEAELRGAQRVSKAGREAIEKQRARLAEARANAAEEVVVQTAAEKSSAEGEIEKITARMRHLLGDQDPYGVKNLPDQGGIPTTAAMARLSAERLAEVEAGGGWSDALKAEYLKKKFKKESKKRADLEAGTGWDKEDVKAFAKEHADEWAKKLEDVKAYHAKENAKAEEKIALLRAKQKVGQDKADTSAKAKKDAAQAKVAEAEAKLAELEAAEAKYQADVLARREKAEAAVARANEGVQAAKEKLVALPQPASFQQDSALASVITNAETNLAAKEKRLQELTSKMLALVRAPDEVAGLTRALGAVGSEATELARQMATRERYYRTTSRAAKRGFEPNPEVLAAYDTRDLADELDFLDRWNRREANRRGVLGVVERLKEAAGYVFRPFSETRERSLNAAMADLDRELSGEMEEVSARIARVVPQVSDAEDPLTGAFDAVVDEVEAFRSAVLDQQIPAQFAQYIAKAYILPGEAVAQERIERLLQAVVDWAQDPDLGLIDLRTALLDVTRKEVAGELALPKIQRPQMGDVFLAYGVGSAGATERLMQKVGVSALDEDSATAVNEVLTDYHYLSGSLQSARGRQRVIRLMTDQGLYSKGMPRVISGDLPAEVAAPVGRAYEAAKLPRPSPQVVADVNQRLGGLIETAERVARNEVYVPHAVREAIDAQIAAVIATARIPGSFDMQSGPLMSYWRQAMVVGVGLSRPGQGFLDQVGDTLQIASRFPVVAAKTFARSALSQALFTPLAAQLLLLVGKARRQSAGDVAKSFDRLVSTLTFSPDVQKVLDMTDEPMRVGGLTGRQAGRLARQYGLYENLVTAQASRSVSLFRTREMPKALSAVGGAFQGAGAGAALGGFPGAVVGALAGAIFGTTPAGRQLANANHAALLDLANTAANRRRAALFVSLLEVGMQPEQAVREAVRLVGAFSRELTDFERTYISWWYPFYTYQKFNTRRLMRLMANPFWIKAIDQGGQNATIALDAWMRDQDEYGFFSSEMADEPDPVALEDAIAEVLAENPQLTDEQVYKEARLRAELAPRAVERYERLKKKLDAMPYDAAKWFVVMDTEDEDLNALRGYYWIPDPTRFALPAWQQERYAVQLAKARSQEMSIYYRNGIGRFARTGDEQRYALLPPDPNVDAMQNVLAAMATAVWAGSHVGAMLGGGEPAVTTGPTDLLGATTGQPIAQTLLGIAGMVDPEGQRDTPIPAGMAQNLQDAGLGGMIRVSTPLTGSTDPADQGTMLESREPVYAIKAEWSALLYLAPQMSAGLLGTLDLAKVKQGVMVEGRTRGEADITDQLGMLAEVFLGQKVYTSSPSAQEFFAGKEVEKRIEAAVEKVAPAKVGLPESPATLLERNMTRLEAQAGYWEALEAAKRRAARGETPNNVDTVLLKSELRRRGVTSEQLAEMDVVTLLQQFRTPSP